MTDLEKELVAVREHAGRLEREKKQLVDEIRILRLVNARLERHLKITDPTEPIMIEIPVTEERRPLW